MSDSSNLDNKLKNEKLSFTQQRRVILEEIEKKDCHLTADEIYFVVKKRMPKVSVGTIYRNLSVLVELNLIDKVKTSLHDESYYEIHSDPHYHIICTKCLRIDDLEHYRALSIEPTAEKISGYTINHHLIELHGICPHCKAKLGQQEKAVDAPRTIGSVTIPQITTLIQSPMPQRTAVAQERKESVNLVPPIKTVEYKTVENTPSEQSSDIFPNTLLQPTTQKDQKRKFFFGRRHM